MSDNTSVQYRSVVTLPILLTVLFVGLKLTGHITWSWWWVVSPTLISLALGVTFLVVAFVILVVVNGSK